MSIVVKVLILSSEMESEKENKSLMLKLGKVSLIEGE